MLFYTMILFLFINFLGYIYCMFPDGRMSIFIFIVCAEAYNPDEEEDDAESRVCNLLKKLILNYTPVLDQEYNNRKEAHRHID